MYCYNYKEEVTIQTKECEIDIVWWNLQTSNKRAINTHLGFCVCVCEFNLYDHKPTKCLTVRRDNWLSVGLVVYIPDYKCMIPISAWLIGLV